MEDYSDFILPEETQETATPTTEETQEQQTEVEASDTTQTETQQEEAQTEVPKIKVKFLHEEKELTPDEATPLIQKGMNYDRLQEKLKSLETDPRLSKYDKVKQLADAYGMSDDEMLDALYNQYFEATAKNQGLTPEQVRKDHELKQRENNVNQKEQTLTSKQQEQKMYEQFALNFPNAKAEDIKLETWAKVNNGMDLTTAYVQQQNEDLKAQLQVLRQNQENAKKAPVGSVTAHGSEEPAAEDDFLKGFNSI